MGVASTGYFSALLAPGLRKVYFDEAKDFPEEYSKVLKVLSSKRAYEEDIMMGGLGLFQRKTDGHPTSWDNGLIGTAKRFTHVAFSLGFRVTREMNDDDQYDIMKKMSRQLARSARLTVEMEVGAMFDDSFTGTYYTSADGIALCAASTHVLLTAGTTGNRPATEIDLSLTGLRAALENMEGTLDERGLPAPRTGTKLIVSPTFQWVAREITESEKKPYTSDNEINVMKDLSLKHMVYHYSSDPDAWWLQAPDHDWKFFWRTKAEFNSGDDPDTKDAKFYGYMRFSMGATDWRGMYGSTGI